MQTSCVAGFLDGLYRVKSLDDQMGSVGDNGEITGFLAARAAKQPADTDTPARPLKIVVRMMPMVNN